MPSNANWHAFLKYKGLVWIVTVELSPEEERHLFNLSVIPAAVVTYFLVICFVYFAHSWQSFSMLQYLAFFGIPFVFGMPTTLLLSFKVLHSRTSKATIRDHAKRLFGRMTILFMGVLLFALLLVATYLTLLPLTGEGSVLLVSGRLWFLTWIPSVFRTRTTLHRLYKGRW